MTIHPLLFCVLLIASFGFGNGVSAKAERGRELDISLDSPDSPDDRGSEDFVSLPAPLPATVQRPPSAPQTFDVVETMIRAGGFQNLIKLLFTAGLVDTLKTPGPFTVFAPSNTALPTQSLADLVLAEPIADLQDILKYHVVPGIIRSSDLMDGMTLTTVQGQDVIISIDNGNARVNNVNIRRTDITADNGIIHSIDNMLMVF